MSHNLWYEIFGEWTCICKSCWCEQQGTTVLNFVGVSISNYCANLLCCSDTKLKWLLLHVKHVEEPDGCHFSHKLDHQFCIPCSFWLCAMFIPTWGLYCFLKQQHVFSRFSSWRGDCCIENSYWGSFQIHSTRCCRFGRHPILRLWCFDRRRCGHFCAPWAQFMEGPWQVAGRSIVEQLTHQMRSTGYQNSGYHMEVSSNRGTPKTSICKGISIIHHPFWGTPMTMETSMAVFFDQSSLFQPSKLPWHSLAASSLHPNRIMIPWNPGCESPTRCIRAAYALHVYYWL